MAELFEFVHAGFRCYAANREYQRNSYESRKADLEQRKIEELPDFPNSLVCPRCLLVIRRA